MSRSRVSFACLLILLATARIGAVGGPFAFAAALAVAPADRLALADRLFNGGDYALAASEYAALEGQTCLSTDAWLYRCAECDRLLGKRAAAQARFKRILAEFPTSTFADAARLRLALEATGEARLRELRLLDTDRVRPSLRAEALYHLGEACADAAAYERCAKIDPKGPYRDHAILRRAVILSKSTRPEERRQAVAQFLEIAFGGATDLAECALYLAAATSFADRQYDETGSLAKRYLKNFRQGPHAESCLEMSAWCHYMGGRYADAIVACGEGRTDGTAYVRAVAAQATGDEAQARRWLSEYLERYPQGRYRREAELAVARLDYGAAEKAGDGARAVEAARRSVRLSEAAEDRLRLGWAYEKSGRGDEAVAAYAAVAEKHPGTSAAATALYHKAMVDLRAERWAAAELALREALAGALDAQRRGSAQYWCGMAACRLGHETEGVAMLKAAVETGVTLDESREARLTIADIDFNGGRTNEAIRAYAQLVRDGALVRMSAAKTLAVGRLLAAPEKKACAEALAKSVTPQWRQAGYALWAEAETELGHAAAAEAALEKCVAEPCETEALADATIRLGWFRLKHGNHDGAEQLLKRAIALNAQNRLARAEAYLALAQNAVGAGKTEEAKGYATVVVTLFESSPHAAAASALLKQLEAR